MAFSGRLWLLSATFFFVFMGAGAQQAYLVPYLGKVTDWSQVKCGSIVALVYFSMLLFRVINVYLFPRWSDRRFTIVGGLTYLVFTIGMFAIPYVPSYPLAVFMSVFWGFGGALMWTGTAMQTLDIADKAGGRHGTGMGVLYSSTHAGWLAGAIVLGMLYDRLPDESAHLMYAAAAGFTLIGNVLSLFLPATGQALRETPPLLSLLKMVTRERALISGLLQFTAALAYGLILGAFGTYIEKTYGSQLIWVAIQFYPATRMVLSYMGGSLTDKIGHVPVLSGGFLSGVVGLVITVMWVNPYAVVIAALALGLLGSTVPVVAAAIVGDAADAKRRPLVYGIVFAWRDLGVAVAAFGSSVLGLKFSFDTVFMVFIYTFAACAVLSLYLGRFTRQDI